MSARIWWRVALGVVLIGGILVGLWVEYGRKPLPEDEDRAAAPRLVDAAAVVKVHDGSGTRPASIACDGDDRRASGFWASDAVQACDALASTQAALVSGRGCPRIGRRHVGIVVTGSFGGRRFAHRAVRGGCPDPDDWLAVSALALPVLGPDQELDDPDQRGTSGGGGSTSP